MDNHKKLPCRKVIRLKGYDYSRAGSYFITICCQDRICRFGYIEEKQMILNEYGQIAHNEWMKLPERFPHFILDTFQIMPNHIHGIITLTDAVGSGFTPGPFTPGPDEGQPQGVAPTNVPTVDGQPRGVAPTEAPTGAPTIGNIIGAYKSLVANGCLEIYKSNNKRMGKLWQRSYYEHIIRNKEAYHRISEYIKKNPAKWDKDKFHPK